MIRITFLLCVMLGLYANAADSATIGEAKSLSDGTMIAVTGSVTLLEPAECYIESTDRSSGIRVQADTAGFGLGNLVTATGTLGALDGERIILGATLAVTGAASPIAPLGLRNNWLGGSCQVGGASLQDYIAFKIPLDGTGRRWDTVGGAPNTGVLVTTWGTINAVYESPITGAHWFYIDDGSGVVSDYGDKGIIVYSDADVRQGDFVTVTGVSSTEVSFDSTSRLARSIRPRTADDVHVLVASVSLPVCPFSDEFDQPTLDDRWILLRGNAPLSLTSNPGWLEMPADATQKYSCCILQGITGNSDLYVRVRPRFDSVSSAVAVALTLGMKDDMRWPPSGGVGVSYLATVARAAPGAGVGVIFGDQSGVILGGDTAYLKARLRGSTAYVSASADGVTYSPEVSCAIGMRYLGIWAYASGLVGSFAPVVDYYRCTRVSE